MQSGFYLLVKLYRLKDKHRQNDMKRLKKKMHNEESPTPTKISTPVAGGQLTNASNSNFMALNPLTASSAKPIEVGNEGFFDD